MNTKETLKKLHETFPDFDTDTLLKILDCCIEDSITINTLWNSTTPSPKPLENIIYCQDEINATRYY